MADMFSSGSIPNYEKALDVLSSRHRVVAHNIANMNTPNFKAKDINFQDILGRILTVSDSVDGVSPEDNTSERLEWQIYNDLENRVKESFVRDDVAYRDLLKEVSELSKEVEGDEAFDDDLVPFEINPEVVNPDGQGNDVELDTEMAKLAETTLLYNMMIKATVKRLRQIDMAIRESI